MSGSNSKLTAALQRMLARAVTDGTQEYTFAHGLRVRVAANPPRFALTRAVGQWGPSEASEREAHTGAKYIGWGAYSLRWQGKWLICEKTEPLLGGDK